jgi:hypothetical protein
MKTYPFTIHFRKINARSEETICKNMLVDMTLLRSMVVCMLLYVASNKDLHRVAFTRKSFDK